MISPVGGGLATGMTLRQYFMAHAPAAPQSWFEPVMALPCPPEPACTAEISQILSGRIIAGWISDSLIEELEGDCKLFAEARRRIWAWNIERDKQRFIQWPAAWADAMIAESMK